MTDVDAPIEAASESNAPRPRWFVPALIAAGAVVVLAAAGSIAVGVALTAPRTFNADGYVVIENTTCDTIPDGFQDITPGTDVVVKDPAGKTVAFAQLQDGKNITGAISSCAFPFKLKDVPAGLGIYSVEASHRGALQYDEARLRKDGVVMSLTAQ